MNFSNGDHLKKTDRKIERKCKDRKRNCGCETHGKGY
jgi:hypothetical protein